MSVSRSPLSPSPAFWPWRTFPVHVVLFALLLYFIRFGYDFANSDQDELLPYLLHRMSPDLFVNDWFVQTQAAGFNVRLYVTVLLEGLSAFFPVWLAVLLVYMASWIGIATAIFQFSYVLTRKTVAAAGTILVALVLTPQWTLGGNDLVHAMFVPSMLGWALGLWGVCFYLQRRWVVAAILLGVASWMQALVGLQLALVLGLVSCFSLISGSTWRQTGWRQLITFSLTFLLAALPTLIPILSQQLSTPASGMAESPSLAYIFAAFRAPHHFLSLSYPMRSVVRFGLLALLGLGAFFYLRHKRALPHTAFCASVIAIVAGLMGIAFVFTEVVPVFFIIKLQLFKLTVFLKLLFVALIMGACAEALPRAWQTIMSKWLRPNRWWLLAACFACGLIGWGIASGYPYLYSKAQPLAHSETSLAQVERWAKTYTDTSAVFAVPPSFSGFRSRSERAIVINFKAYPFQDEHMRTWFNRLLDIAPIELPDRGGAKLIPQLDEAFASQNSTQLARLAQTYQVDYIVRRTPLIDSTTFRPVFEAAPWHVYRYHSSSSE